MSHRTIGVMLAGLLCALPAAPAVAQTPSCLNYMPDPRAEAWQGSAALTQADALVASVSNFLPSPLAGTVRMVVYPWTAFHGSWVTACRWRDYHGQPWTGVGSAILVGSQRLLTARHLFTDGVPCEQQRYVFGFGNFRPGQWQMTCSQDTDPGSTVCWVDVPEQDVYSCSSAVLGGIEPGTSGDWAVVTLDRAVEGRTPLRILRDPAQFPPVGAPVTIVGHPNRIPMKVEKVTVKNAGPSSYSTTGHVIKGHSGSMAVDEDAGRVIGVVFAGGHPILPGCPLQTPPHCYREWFDYPAAGAWLTPAWLAKDYIPEP